MNQWFVPLYLEAEGLCETLASVALIFTMLANVLRESLLLLPHP